MAHSKYSIAVDLGESSVTVVAGRRGDDDMIEIAAVARRKTQGLRAGRIENIAHINDALSKAIAEIESKLGLKVCQAYGGLSGEFVRCAHHTETVIVAEPNNGVATSDVVALHNLMRDVLPPINDMILEYTPENYIVDGRRDVKDPIGAFCRSLSSSFIFSLCDKEAHKRLSYAFVQAGITLKRCFANSVAAAEAVVSSEEREAGVAVIDLGEGVTNLAIYHKGALRYMASIPIGGSAINRDLKTLMVQEKSVESIKLKYGCAIAELADMGSVTIEGRTPRERHNIPIYNIAVAIEQRLIDIATFVEREIRDAKYEGRLHYGIVLTGGGANLKHVDELFRNHLALDVRIGVPESELAVESFPTVGKPEYATVVGILRRGIELDERGVGKECTRELEEESPTEESEEVAAAESKEVESKEVEKVKEVKPTRAEERATQSSLDLHTDEEEDEEYEEEEEDEGEENRKRGGMNFFKRFADKVNKLFSSDEEEKF